MQCDTIKCDAFRISPEIAEHFGVEGDWRFGQHRYVEWSDLDGLGHVNNARYIEWCQEARIQYWRAVTGGWPGQTGVNIVVRKLDFTFDASLHMGQQALVTVRMRNMGRTSFVQDYAVWCDGLIGYGQTVCVAIDPTTMNKSPIPAALRTCFDAFEGLAATA